MHHPNNTTVNYVHVLGDLEQELRCQKGAMVGQSSLCHHPKKNSSSQRPQAQVKEAPLLGLIHGLIPYLF